jgi:hypothetical protein
MVTINFEIDGFDLAGIIKSVAGVSGVNINIYTLQEVSEVVPQGVANHEVVEETIEETEIELIDDSLSHEERNEFALQMRDNGSSWKQVGRALGVTPKSASRRLTIHLNKQTNALAKAERKAKREATEMNKPEYTELTDLELIQGIHSTISVKGSGRGVYMSSDYATMMITVTDGRNYRDSKSLREFKRTINQKCDDLFRKVGMCLGVGVAISGNTIDEHRNKTVQIMVVKPESLPNYDSLVESMRGAGLI